MRARSEATQQIPSGNHNDVVAGWRWAKARFRGRTKIRPKERAEIRTERSNNSFHSSIGMLPFEALHGRLCRSPICLEEAGDRVLLGPRVIEQTTAKIRLIKACMKVTQDRQKSYADRRRCDLEFLLEIMCGLGLCLPKGCDDLEFQGNSVHDMLDPLRFWSMQDLQPTVWLFHLSWPGCMMSSMCQCYTRMCQTLSTSSTTIPSRFKKNVTYEETPT